jgi:hypothetical protein
MSLLRLLQLQTRLLVQGQLLLMLQRVQQVQQRVLQLQLRHKARDLQLLQQVRWLVKLEPPLVVRRL